jgi:acyl-CoA thioester hydrolase
MKKQKYSRNDFEHWMSLQTRWRDLDAMGHINHAAYLTFMENARLEFYESLGFSTRNSGEVDGIILASMNVQYHQQVIHPSGLDIGQRIVRVGNKSFDMLTAIFLKDNESPVLSALFTLVAFNYKLNKTIPAPDKIRDMCREL